MSPEALPETVPQGSPAGSLLDDYVSRDFAVFSFASSDSPGTELAMARLVEMASEQRWSGVPAGSSSELSHRRRPRSDLFSSVRLGAMNLVDNRYFERLHQLGYSITTYQTAYLGFCTGHSVAGDECYTYNYYGHGHSISAQIASRTRRLAFALDMLDYEYQRAGYIGRSVVLYSMWKYLFSEFSIEGSQARILMALAIAQMLGERLRDLEPGRAYFAHLLLPHSPYILDEDCRIKDSSKWFTTEIAWQRQAVYPAYWQQSICANKLVMEMIDNAGSRSGAKLPIVIVHGDHGSRISYYDPATRDSPDPRDMLTTFLAVRLPGLEPRKISRPVNLQWTFAVLIGDWIARMRK
jgi:hypothetical protein